MTGPDARMLERDQCGVNQSNSDGHSNAILTFLHAELAGITHPLPRGGTDLMTHRLTHFSARSIPLARFRLGSRVMTRRVLLYPGEDGFVVAEVPSLPGCISQGKTREEALENVREAISLHEEVLRERGEPLPEDRVELVEVAA